MEQESISLLLDKLSLAGLLKAQLPHRLRGWSNELGLFVRPARDGRKVLAGGRWRPYIDARLLPGDGWRVDKFDEDTWVRRFAALVGPTLDVTRYLCDCATEMHRYGYAIQPLVRLKNCIDRYRSTAHWEAPLFWENLGDPWAAVAGADQVFGVLREVYLESGRYKELEEEIRRKLRVKVSYISLPEDVQWTDFYNLGMLYLSDMSYELRGRGLFSEDMEARFTAKELACDPDELRWMAIDNLAKALELGLRHKARVGSAGEETDRLIRRLEVGLRAAQTRSVSSFERLDTLTRGMDLETSPMGRESDRRTAELVIASRTVVRSLERSGDAFIAYDQCLSRQEELYSAGRYKEMEEEAKRGVEEILSNGGVTQSSRDAILVLGYNELGMIYFAALSHSVREVGILNWKDGTSGITAANLGYDVRELQTMSLSYLGEVRDLLEHRLSKLGEDGSPISEWLWTEQLERTGLALVAAETMAVDSFEEFDNCYGR